MQAALEKLWPFTGELFEMDAVDQMAMQQGFGMDLTSFQPDWLAEVQKTLADAGLKQPADSYMHTGSRQGIHTEHLGHLLSEMQYLVRAYPDANW